jgi:hypothetical protein
LGLNIFNLVFSIVLFKKQSRRVDDDLIAKFERKRHTPSASGEPGRPSDENIRSITSESKEKKYEKSNEQAFNGYKESLQESGKDYKAKIIPGTNVVADSPGLGIPIILIYPLQKKSSRIFITRLMIKS